MTAPFDPGAFWRALPPDVQEQVGMAAVAFAAGVAAEEDAPPGQSPGSAAATTSTMVLGELLRAHMPPEGAIGVIDLGPIGVRVCHGCGCSDYMACDGGCAWVAANLCSRCAPPRGPGPRRLP